MSRSLEQIRSERDGIATTRNLVAVLNIKLELAGRYGMYEYEAGEENNDACAAAFAELAKQEREQVARLLQLLSITQVSGRFVRPATTGEDVDH